MKTMTRACAILIAAGGLALSAGSASAVEPRDAVQPSASAITAKSYAPAKQLITKAPEPKKIVVAGRRGRAIGLGILAGVGTAILLSKSARAHRRGRYYDDGYRYRSKARRHYNRCERWEYRCHELGVRRACRKFYNRCAY